MKMFDYVRPATIAEAVAAAAEPGAAYLAGGTNLVDLMKVGTVRPDRLVDVTRLAGLDRLGGTFERLALDRLDQPIYSWLPPSLSRQEQSPISLRLL